VADPVELSVVMSTFNRGRLLGETLAGLRAAARRVDVGWEVVVVDNNSTDDTRAVIERVAREEPRIRYVFEGRQGVSFGRNTAVEASRGPVVLITDDDVLVDESWMRVGHAALGDPAIAWVMGRILPHWSSPAPDWVPRDLTGPLGLCDLGDAAIDLGPGSPYLPMTANMGIRRDVYLKLGGLDTGLGPSGRGTGARGTFSGEDYEFGLRLLDAGHRGRYVPGLIVKNRIDTDRLTRTYYRRWMHANGRAESIMSRDREAHLARWLGVPRNEFRQAAEHAMRWARLVATGRGRQAFVHELHLRAFAGFVGDRWRRRP
jgi:glycosyltransferase involved in cell wall biosynthesis